jgi:hypothetical protein
LKYLDSTLGGRKLGFGASLNSLLRHPFNRYKRRAFRQRELAQQQYGPAFKALAIGKPDLAAALFEKSIGPDLEPVTSEVLHQYGVALAWVGRLADAERVLRIAARREPTALIAYRFGSVLAERRKFSEASSVLATIDRPEPWMAGGSMHSINFPATTHELREFDVPFRRMLGRLFDASANGRDFVYLVAADTHYAKRFARALHSSLAAVQANCLLHIHIINPDGAALRLLEYMKQRPGPPVAFSSEEVDLSSLTDDQKRVYYASARFFVLPALRRHYDRPVIAADIDQVVLRDPASLIDSSFDVLAIRFPYGRFNLLSRFSASAIIASTRAAATYFDRVAAYLAERMGDARAIAWHLDQVALDVVHLVSDDIVLRELPDSVMLSAGPDAHVPDDTFFWSVTYSIAANARKLSSPILQKLETAPLIVITPVFDHPEGLERTIASVARDGHANVTHVVVDHRRLNPVDAIAPSQPSGEAFADLIREIPNPIFVELPCGTELGERTLLEIMLAVENALTHRAPKGEVAEQLELAAGVGLGSKGERLTVHWSVAPEWTKDARRMKVVLRP